jgi:hypothetical protein
MSYVRGNSANIIVGAAALFTFDGELTDADISPLFNASSNETASLKDALETSSDFDNVGYTSNGLEITFQPDFGEVQVDQVLDAAKLYKQGMTVNLNTSFAEATLENLLVAIAGSSDDLTAAGVGNTMAAQKTLNMASGNLGECPLERGLVAVGPGTGDCEVGSSIERVYIAYRALSIENVTVSAKRNEPTMFDVSFRLLPNSSGSYGKIIDRVVAATAS